MAYVLQFDSAWLLWLNGHVTRWPLLDKALAWSLDAELLKFGVLTAIVCFLWFQKVATQQDRRAKLVMTLLSGLAALFLGRLLALTLPFRERPFNRLELGIVTPLNFEPGLRTWSTFPSDHAMMAFALSTGLWLIHRPIGLLAFAHSMLVICLPRVYFGLHYPSDIVGGAVIGILVVLILDRDALRRSMSSPVLAMEERFSGLFYSCSFLLLYQIATMFEGMRFTVASLFRLLHRNL